MKKIPQGKVRYVKVTAVGTDEDGEFEDWYAIGTSRNDARDLANQMGMPTDNRHYVDVYLTPEQYKEIPEW